MSIYFFHGDEDYNIEQEIKKLKKKLLDKNFAAMNFKTANNPNFADLISLLRTQPMMFGTSMIVINCKDYFSKTAADEGAGGDSKGFSDKQLEEISNAIEDNQDNICIIFVVNLPRNEGKKIDSRKKIYKIIAKYGQVQEFPTFKTYKVDDISNWINKEAKKHEITFEKPAMLALIEQVGNNLRELSLELEKLALLAHPEKIVTKKMVKEICISNEDLFTLADYILKGQKALAIIEFHKLLERSHPLKIMSALQTMLRKWITIKAKSKEVSLAEISKLTGQHEFVVKTTLEKMKNTPLADLVKLKQNLINSEFKIKAGESLNVEDEIENAILTV